MIGSTRYGFKHSVGYELGVEKLQASSAATSVLGTPITTGFPFGSINLSGASGTAILNFSATGPKAAGQVFLEAIKKDGVWSIRRLMLKPDGSDQGIEIVNGTPGGAV